MGKPSCQDVIDANLKTDPQRKFVFQRVHCLINNFSKVYGDSV